MAGKRITIQKDNYRYTFDTLKSNTGRPIYRITTETCSALGGSMSFHDTTKKNGNQFYLDRMAQGFKKFRTAQEISWYATMENNTPYAEEWTIDGDYLVPIKSRVLGEE